MRAPVTCPVGRPFESTPAPRNRRDCRSATPVVARTVSPFSTSFRFLPATLQLTHPLMHVGCRLLDWLAPSTPLVRFSPLDATVVMIGVPFPLGCPVGLARTAVLPPQHPHFTVRTGDREGVRS